MHRCRRWSPPTMACLRLLNSSVEIFANLVNKKTAKYFSSQVDHWIFLVCLIRQDALAKRLDYKCQPTLAALAQHGMSELQNSCKTMMSSNASLRKIYHSLTVLLSDQNFPFQNIWRNAFHTLCQFVAPVIGSVYSRGASFHAGALIL